MTSPGFCAYSKLRTKISAGKAPGVAATDLVLQLAGTTRSNKCGSSTATATRPQGQGRMSNAHPK